MLAKSVQSMEPALHREYWKEMTVNSTIEQHPRNHIKRDQENTAGGYRKGYWKCSHHLPWQTQTS